MKFRFVIEIPHVHAFKKGFALVVTLSLMILLTVIAVGLLSLSAVISPSSTASVRTLNRRPSDMSEACREQGDQENVHHRESLCLLHQMAGSCLIKQRGDYPEGMVGGSEKAGGNGMCKPIDIPPFHLRSLSTII